MARYKGVSREAEHSQSLKKVSHHFCVVVRGMRPSRSLILTPNIHKRNGYQAFMAGVAYVFAEFFLSSHQAAMPLLLTSQPTDIYYSSHISSTSEDCTF